MKKRNFKANFRVLGAIALAFVIAAASLPISMAAESTDNVRYDYTIVDNPYETVNWDTWKAYRMATHVHTVRSDGDVEIDDMLEEYYRLGYQGVALTDHGTVDYGWTSKQSRLALYGYQAFVHGSLDPLTAERAEQMHNGTDRNGDGMTEIPLGIELNGASTNKCHINSYFADCGHGDLEISTTWPRTAVEKSHKAGGITHINHVGEWAEAKDDIGVYDAEFISDFASIYMDYSSCVGMELVNTADSRTRNDRYLYDETLKILAPQGRNIFGFCEDDSHELEDCARNAQFFVMPENNASNVRTSMETGAFFACSKNAKTDEELKDGFSAVGDFPMVSRVDVDEDEDTISISPYNATVVKMVADGVVIDTKQVSYDNEVITFDLNDYDGKIGSYVRFYAMGAGGICYVQPFLLEKTELRSNPVKFDVRITGATITVTNENGEVIPASSNLINYNLDQGKYKYSVTLDGFETVTGEINVTYDDLVAGTERVISVELNKIVIYPKKDTTTVDHENRFIYGVEPGIDSLSNYIKLESGANVTYNETANGFGTGTQSVVTYGQGSDRVYTLVIFGDVTGDGFYDGQDAFVVSLLSMGILTKEDVSEAVWFAADCNHDGSVDENDVAILNEAGLLIASVEQNGMVMETSEVYSEYLGLIDQSPDFEEENAEKEVLPVSPTETEDTESGAEILNTVTEIIEKIFNFIKSVFDKLF